MTKRIKKEELEFLIEEIKKGNVVSFPTDTVYGIACKMEEQAVQKMKWVKGRDEKKPFPTMVSSLKQIHDIAEVPALAEKMIKNFMPGAMTLVLRKKEVIPDLATNGQPTIAIRMPDDETVLTILKETGPLLVTSANLSGMPAAHTTEEVLAQLEGRISCVLEGTSAGNLASTIVDCTGVDLKVLREGPITLEMMMEKL